jgi:hypothetical protein
MRGSTAERITTTMKNVDATAQAVEKVMNATNLTASAALEEVKKADADESAAVAKKGDTVAPAKASSKKDASQKKNAPKAKQGAKKAAPKTKAAKKEAKAKPAKEAKPAAKKEAKDAAVPREFSKKAIILDLLRRKQGATMAEIMKATGWQAHSVRGFVSGTLMKKMDLPVESFKNATDERTYRIAK